jgi:hypothetical protein
MMNHEHDIEQILRQTPHPPPPPGLKQTLLAQMQLAPRPSLSRASVPVHAGWFSRWWPALVPAAVSAACAVVLTFQQMEIRDLKEMIETLSQSAASAPATTTTGTDRGRRAASTDPALSQQEEMARLGDQAAKLRTQLFTLDQLRTDNASLRARIAAPTIGFLTPEEQAALEKASERAKSIQCVNNLKQLGLSLRIWAVDNGDIFPPAILDMTNEMNTPKILFCPADTARQQATGGWAAYTTANCSYEYLAPSASSIEPQRVAFKCPIHGSVTLCDGSVQRGAAKDHPDWLIQRDGKLYFEAPPPADAPPKAAPADPNQNPGP